MIAANSSGLIEHAPPLLVLATVITTGHLMARVAEQLRLPAITGKIIGGMLLGRFGIALFSQQAYAELDVVINIALAVIVFNIGSHLDARRLVGARKRILVIALSDGLLTGGLVFAGLALLFPNLSTIECALYGAIAIATAPATTLYIVREQQAKGVFSKTLLAVVALNNVIGITAFEVVRSLGHQGHDASVDLVARALQLGGAFVMGLAFAAVTAVVFPRLRRAYRFSLVFVSLIFMLGLAEMLDISILLPCLVYGATLATTTRAEVGVFDVFENPENMLYAAFFALAGTHLDLDALIGSGVVGLAVLAIRFGSKILAAQVGGRLSRAPQAITRLLGLSLIPQAGVAVGLALLVNEDPVFHAFATQLMTTVLGVVVANELIGPITATRALKLSGEAGRDRLRLVSFLEEEHIVVDLDAPSFEAAIKRLAKVLFRVHHVRRTLQPAILRSIFEREEEGGTYVGEGIAIPHGIYDGGRDIIGVVGISPRGIPAATPGGDPIHIVILIATPDAQRHRHLDVLRAVAQLFGSHDATRQALLKAPTAWQAHQLLQHEELLEDNPYLV